MNAGICGLAVLRGVPCGKYSEQRLKMGLIGTPGGTGNTPANADSEFESLVYFFIDNTERTRKG